MPDKDNDGLKDKDKALELLRDEAGALGMEGFGRLGVEKLTIAIEEFKAEKAKPEVKEEVEELPYWLTRGSLKSNK